MGKILKIKPVKLIIGFIFKEQDTFSKAKNLLIKNLGEFDFKSQALAFNYTDYYKKEFGKGLKRSFCSFKKLIRPEELSKIKTLTNKIEQRLSKNNKRMINLDPGYIDLAKLVLASTKDYSHRIYLKNGIFAEITLVFKGKSFMPQEWTYPDYRTKEYIEILNKIRGIYAAQKNI